MEACSGRLLVLGRVLPVNKQLALPALICDRAGCVGVHVYILQSCCDKGAVCFSVQDWLQRPCAEKGVFCCKM